MAVGYLVCISMVSAKISSFVFLPTQILHISKTKVRHYFMQLYLHNYVCACLLQGTQVTAADFELRLLRMTPIDLAEKVKVCLYVKVSPRLPC